MYVGRGIPPQPAEMSRRPPSIRRTRAQDAQAPSLPDFPNIPDIPMHDQGDFQRFVVDALQAIWARVFCQSRRATGAQAPAPAARRDPSPEDDDATDEDTDKANIRQGTSSLTPSTYKNLCASPSIDMERITSIDSGRVTSIDMEMITSIDV
ncbi:hypothetical protein F2Q70_00029031 [Brassica cretica]|uniref:Uncharacterized protein n=1 Tax=Brassica cretica TaxID=69181 RepID=A0A8S9FID9_BRACR|nr:hypothetical protein F2Q70_00029031 [Brassica cretica]KAF2553744.1 hypothetical protein F2Q68_00033415 [Brassica cretica]